MSVTLFDQNERPPFIQFEDRLEEDRQATIDAGHLVQKTVHYIIVRAKGSKDTNERPVQEWLDYCKKEAEKGRWPWAWLDAHKQAYENYKKGMEIPVNGFPVRQWGAINRAQIENLVSCGVLTVEDMAAANEQCMQRIGMGAVELKRRAQDWVRANTGQLAEITQQVTALQADQETKDATIETQRQKIAELEAELRAVNDAPRKRTGT